LFLTLRGTASLIPLFFAGLMLFASAPAAVVSSQKLLPGRQGIASALQVGFAWGTAGMFMGLVGKAGEVIGIYRLFIIASFLPLIMSLFIAFLKKHRNQFEVSGEWEDQTVAG
jgi:hypothetical protein